MAEHGHEPLRLSMVMIARDEERHVRPCFESFWDQVDEVVLCDTGSRDGTVSEARRFAAERGEPDKLIVTRFKWCDDFSAARNHAHAQATGNVHCWIDLDSRLRGTGLRRVAAWLLDAPQRKGAYVRWRGPITPEVQILMVLRSPVVWRDPVAEGPETDPHGEYGIAHSFYFWHTRKRPSGRRDLDLALAWIEREPDHPRAAYAAAMFAADLYELPVVAECLEAGLALPDAPDEIRGSLLSLWAWLLKTRGDLDSADGVVREALDLFEDAFTPVRERAPGRRVDGCGFTSHAWLLYARIRAERNKPAEAFEAACEAARWAAIPEDLRSAEAFKSTLQKEMELRNATGPYLT